MTDGRLQKTARLESVDEKAFTKGLVLVGCVVPVTFGIGWNLVRLVHVKHSHECALLLMRMPSLREFHNKKRRRDALGVGCDPFTTSFHNMASMNLASRLLRANSFGRNR